MILAKMKSKGAGVSLLLVALVLLSMMSVAVAPAAAESKEVLSPFWSFDFLQDKRASDNDQKQTLKAIEDRLMALKEDTRLMNFVNQNMDDFNKLYVTVEKENAPSLSNLFSYIINKSFNM